MLKDYTILENGTCVDNSLVNYFLRDEKNIIICSSYQNARTAKKSFVDDCHDDPYGDVRSLRIVRFGKIYVVATKRRIEWLILDWKLLLFKTKGMFFK